MVPLCDRLHELLQEVVIDPVAVQHPHHLAFESIQIVYRPTLGHPHVEHEEGLAKETYRMQDAAEPLLH